MKPDNKLASTFQILYLTNMTIFPIVSFLILISFYFAAKKNFNELALGHFKQSFVASVFSGILLILTSGLILTLGSWDSVYTWMFLILYFLCIHTVLILFGVLGLIKAFARKPYTYPVIGKVWK